MRRLFLALCIALCLAGAILIARPGSAAAVVPPPEYYVRADGVVGELVSYSSNDDGTYTALYAPVTGGPSFIIIWGS